MISSVQRLAYNMCIYNELGDNISKLSKKELSSLLHPSLISGAFFSWLVGSLDLGSEPRSFRIARNDLGVRVGSNVRSPPSDIGTRQ